MSNTSSANLPQVDQLEIQNAKKCAELHSNSCVVGVKLQDTLLLVAKKPLTRPLELTQHRVIRRASHNMFVSACGFGIDGDHVVRKAQVEAVSLVQLTELPCETEQIVSKLSEYLRLFATRPDYRPLAVAVLVAGQNVNKSMSLYKISAGGEREEYKACCIGSNATPLMAELEKCPEVFHSTSAALKCVMKLLRETCPRCVEVGVIRDGEDARVLTDAEVSELLQSKA